MKAEAFGVPSVSKLTIINVKLQQQKKKTAKLIQYLPRTDLDIVLLIYESLVLLTPVI